MSLWNGDGDDLRPAGDPVGDAVHHPHVGGVDLEDGLLTELGAHLTSGVEVEAPGDESRLGMLVLRIPADGTMELRADLRQPGGERSVGGKVHVLGAAPTERIERRDAVHGARVRPRVGGVGAGMASVVVTVSPPKSVYDLCTHTLYVAEYAMSNCNVKNFTPNLNLVLGGRLRRGGQHFSAAERPAVPNTGPLCEAGRVWRR